MKVKLVRRWGDNQPGNTVDVDDVQGAWLIDHNLGERSPGTATAGAVAPGTGGPDPLASGDGTRRRPATRKGSRTGERAAPVAGSPTSYTPGQPERPAPRPDQGDPEQGAPDSGRRLSQPRHRKTD